MEEVVRIQIYWGKGLQGREGWRYRVWMSDGSHQSGWVAEFKDLPDRASSTELEEAVKEIGYQLDADTDQGSIAVINTDGGYAEWHS